MSLSVPVGIDFGTLYSCVGIWQHNNIEIMKSAEGTQLIPSCVSFCNTGERLLCDASKNCIGGNPPLHNTIFGVKNLLGRKFDDYKIKQNSGNQSFNVVNNNGRPQIQVDWRGETKYFAAEEISAMVLSKLKRISEKYSGALVKDIVITASTYFNSSQRKAIKDAVAIAGLNMLKIISKPIAATLACQYFCEIGNQPKNILIFDLGSETTEVSIVCVNNGSFEIKAVAFDQGFGGRDFDNRLVKHLTNELKRKLKSDAAYKLQSIAQQAKHSLSSNEEVEIVINGLEKDINFCTKLSQSKFEEVCSDLFKKTLSPVKKALRDAKLSPSFIDHVVLIGGSTRIPKIQKILHNFFPNKTLNLPIDTEVVVAHGAAIYAATLSRDKNICPFIHTEHLSLVGVMPYSLCIGTAEEEIFKIISRNTKVPCKVAHTFSTVTECQSTINLTVYEGERADKNKNHVLCTLQITDIPPASSGFHKINVTINIDENGLLEVTAEENTFISSSLRVICKGFRGLSEEEVNEMAAKEAKRCKEEDCVVGFQQNILKGTKRKYSE